MIDTNKNKTESKHKSKMISIKNSNHKTLKIETDTLYQPTYIESILGQRFIQRLRSYGLYAIGKWYWGKNIIDSINQLFNDASCQRVGKEESNDKGTQETEMEKNSPERKIQSLPREVQSESLLSQMEEIGKVHSKAI